MSEKYVDIGNRLGYVRNYILNMTQEYMAEKLGISVEYYRLLEKGRYLPSIDVINMLHTIYEDIDYILLGTKTNESKFADIFIDVGEVRRENICNILIFKIRGILTQNVSEQSDYRANIYEKSQVAVIRENENNEITPDDRIREILLGEHNYGTTNCSKINNEKVSNEEIAKDMNKSQRTVTRWLNGKATLKSDMVMTICKKYGYSPSYILYGELNSNSRIDKYYEILNDKDKEKIMEFAQMLVKYI